MKLIRTFLQSIKSVFQSISSVVQKNRKNVDKTINSEEDDTIRPVYSRQEEYLEYHECLREESGLEESDEDDIRWGIPFRALSPEDKYLQTLRDLKMKLNYFQSQKEPQFKDFNRSLNKLIQKAERLKTSRNISVIEQSLRSTLDFCGSPPEQASKEIYLKQAALLKNQPVFPRLKGLADAMIELGTGALLTGINLSMSGALIPVGVPLTALGGAGLLAGKLGLFSVIGKDKSLAAEIQRLASDAQQLPNEEPIFEVDPPSSFLLAQPSHCIWGR